MKVAPLTGGKHNWQEKLLHQYSEFQQDKM